MKKLNKRLKNLEQAAAPKKPATLQIVRADGSEGPIQPVPGANWVGLLRLQIVNDDPGDSGTGAQ